jgi:hypothetical protein
MASYKMKITKNKLKQIIKEEFSTISESDYNDTAPWETDSFLEPEEINEYTAAYNTVREAVRAGTLEGSVEDAFHEMLYHLGIYV